MVDEKIQAYRNEMTEKMVEALKQGVAPWQKPWHSDKAPRNAATGRLYNGVNSVILSLIGLEAGWNDPRWATFEQAKTKGWNIRKGSKGIKVIFWKSIAKPVLNEYGKPVLNEDGTPKMKTIPFARFFTVFHASQIDKIPAYKPNTLTAGEANEKAERIIADSGAVIRHGGNRAFYSPEDDYIQLPVRENFIDAAGYYATVLHELGHWTGGKSRLNRDLTGRKSSIPHAREELVAEMCAMFVSAETGIPQTKEHFENHAAYIESWISLLTSDPNALFKAAADANKAAEYILKAERKREKTANETQNSAA